MRLKRLARLALLTGGVVGGCFHDPPPRNFEDPSASSGTSTNGGGKADRSGAGGLGHSGGAAPTERSGASNGSASGRAGDASGQAGKALEHGGGGNGESVAGGDPGGRESDGGSNGGGPSSAGSKASDGGTGGASGGGKAGSGGATGGSSGASGATGQGGTGGASGLGGTGGASGVGGAAATSGANVSSGASGQSGVTGASGTGGANGGSGAGGVGGMGTTNVSGVIFDQTWTSAGSPYLIIGDLTVASLTIQAGVSVQAAGKYEMRVAGTLDVQGSPSAPVTFAPSAQNQNGWKGLIFDSSGTSTLSRFTLSGSTQSGITIISSPVTIKNCAIQNNSSAQGGGLFASGAGTQVVLSNCVVANNSADHFFEAGGGLFVGMGATVTVQNSIFHDNTTVYANARGGAVYACGGTTQITNSTLVKNGASVYGTGSGAIAINTGPGSCASAIVDVRNSIVFDNTAFDVTGTATVNYSDIQNGYPGTGNLTKSPIFADADYHLFAAASPCVDQGDPSAAMNDACSSPALGTSRNDMGAFGGPLACSW